MLIVEIAAHTSGGSGLLKLVHALLGIQFV
jgi:hypothetical protein